MANTNKIILAKNIKLDKNYRQVLGYSEVQMLALVEANKVIEASDYNFNRLEKNSIKVAISYSDAINCNYIAFQNTDFSNKWFFAFIDNIKFLNNNTIEIFYTIDVFSTWFDYWTAKACFVLREHATTDVAGDNLVPENLELGDHIVNQHLTDSYNNQYSIVMGSTVAPSDLVSYFAQMYDGIPSGATYYRYDSITDLRSAISALNNASKADAITSIFIAPKWLVGGSTYNEIIPSSDTPHSFSLGISRLATLNGYTPVNKKLLTYPYVYMLLSNNAGGVAIYHQEYWNLNESNEMSLKVYGCLTPGCSIRAYPEYYNGDGLSTDEGLTLGKFPQINWVTDQYTNWLTQQGVNIGASALSIAGGIALTVASEGALASLGGGMIMGGVGSIANSISQNYEKSLIPPQVQSNVNSGDVTTAIGSNRYHLYKMSIRYDFAERIDKFFTRYGYAINKNKVPNMTHRQNYNFVKIANEEVMCYPNGHNNVGIPAPDMDLINNIFRNGVTIWNNYTNFGDYSVSNTITS